MQEDSIEKWQSSPNPQVTIEIMRDGFSFNQFLEKNEKSSQTTAKKGIVSNMLSGIEKKTNMFSTGPSNSEHFNNIKVMSSPNRKYVVSYDINGIIHFWE